MSLFSFIACTEEENHSLVPLFEIVETSETGISFSNRLRESATQNVLTYEYYYNGAGLAVADFNQDEYPDLYFVSNLEANQLYLNQGDFEFQEVAKTSQVQGRRSFDTGVSIVDINADGRMDIYLCRSGRFTDPDFRRNALFVNQGNDKNGVPIFEEQAQKYGLDIAAYSTQATFFDYDKDGDLDLFLINHDIDTYDTSNIESLQNQQSDLVGEMLLRNDNQYFTEVTQETGIINNRLGFGLGIAVGDLNNDNYPDVYVSNDYSGKDHLYINQTDGTFKEKIRELTRQTSFYSMGNDIGDINNDGWQDIVNLDMVAADNYGIKTSMSAMNPQQFQQLVDLGQHHQYMFNSLLLNNGKVISNKYPQFSNIGQLLGISNTDWSWAPLLFDMDNDGWQDLFITNGIKRNIRNNDAMKKVNQLNDQMLASNNPNERAAYFQQMLQQFPYHRKANYFFKNHGRLSFENITKNLGLDSLYTASNGAVYTDLDLDGDLDLVVNNVDAPVSVLKNNSTNNYLKVSLKGSETNPFGIGAKVIVKSNGQTQIKELYTSRGYLSAMEPILHFGLAQHSIIEELRIVWSDGKSQVLSNLKANQLLVVDHQNAKNITVEEIEKERIFSTINSKFLNHRHQENPFNDFDRESLLPHKMSNIGPALAVGDVNGDGRDDIFVGGAKDELANLYLQQANENFKPSNSTLWIEEKNYEDVEAILFDADQDGDLDLLVGSGSNEWEIGSEAYRLRYYENDGAGNFIKKMEVLPDIRVSVGTIATADFDGDKDLDLFIGGRQTPANYPAATNSYLLRNDSQNNETKFSNITRESAPFLSDYGMVTDALWVDYDSDEDLDLILVGEWMPVSILENKNGQFDRTTAIPIDDSSGWWYSIATADFDQDGDMDLVAGNLGLNYKYKASKDAPFEIFTKDFDESGNLDIVLSYHSEGEVFPLRGRECSSSQMPFIKDKFKTYEAFGQASISQVYGSDNLEAATHYAATNFAHCYFENDGRGSFEMHQLPIESQVSSINDFLIDDFDKDGELDILVAGNLFSSEVETPRNDASIGLLLKGNKGSFEAVPAWESGIELEGEVRHLTAIHIGNSKGVLIGTNDGYLQLME